MTSKTGRLAECNGESFMVSFAMCEGRFAGKIIFELKMKQQMHIICL